MKRLISIFILFSFSLKSQPTIFVDAAASGLNNGASWENAFLSLSESLATAHAGDEIWVAKGVYQPSPPQDRTAHFLIPCSVRIYGGFAGNETSVGQRDLLTNISILDGNIGNPNLPSDNLYHVVYVVNCDSTTLLDGFRIINGYANSSGKDGMGGGVLFETDDPSVETTTVIRNCDFRSNFAVRGGGFSSLGNPAALPGLRIENTRFFQNKSQLEGGAMHMDGQVIPTRQVIFNTCHFAECRTIVGNGGAISFENFGGVFLLDSCFFEKDSTMSGFEGGALQIILAESSVALCIKNSEFDKCYSAGGGALFINDYGYVDFKTLDLKIQNSRFNNNTSYNEGGGILIHNVFKGSTSIKFDQVLFENNHASSEGSGVFFYNQKNSELNLTIINSKFIENRGGSPGGGALAIVTFGNNTTATNNVKISNSLFSRNRGAYSITSGENCRNFTYMLNNTFVDNSKYVFNKSWYPNSDPATRYNYMEIHNCVIVDTTELKRIFYNNMFNPFTMHDYRVDYCLLSKPDCLFEGGKVCGENMLYDVDPAFLGNSFVPERCSPLVNAGNNFWPDTFNILTDLLQNARISFDTVDIGAYETTQACISGLFRPPNGYPGVFRLLKNPLVSGEGITILCDFPFIDEVEIYNSMGKRIVDLFRLYCKGGQLNIPDQLKAGVYFIRIRFGQRYQTLKLVVTN